MEEFDQLGKDQRGEGAAHDIRNMVFDELFPKMLEKCIDLDEVKPHTQDFVVKNMKFADVEYIFGEEEEMGSPKQCAEMLDAWINEELIDSDPIPQNQTEQNPGSGLGFAHCSRPRRRELGTGTRLAGALDPPPRLPCPRPRRRG